MEWKLDWPVWNTSLLDLQLRSLIELREKQRNVLRSYRNVFRKEDLLELCETREIAERLLEFGLRASIFETRGADIVKEDKRLYCFSDDPSGESLKEAVYVAVRHGSNVASPSYESVPNPYVKIVAQTGSTGLHKTATMKTHHFHSNDPHWNEVFVFFVSKTAVSKGKQNAKQKEPVWETSNQTKSSSPGLIEIALCSKSLHVAKPDFILGTADISKNVFASKIIWGEELLHGSPVRSFPTFEIDVGYLKGTVTLQVVHVPPLEQASLAGTQHLYSLIGKHSEKVGYNWSEEHTEIQDQSSPSEKLIHKISRSLSPQKLLQPPVTEELESDPDIPLVVRHKAQWKDNVATWMKEYKAIEDVVKSHSERNEVPFLFCEPEKCFQLLSGDDVGDADNPSIATLRFVLFGPLFDPLCHREYAHQLFEALLMIQLGRSEYLMHKSTSQPLRLMRDTFLEYVASLETVVEVSDTLDDQFDKTFPMIKSRLGTHEHVLLACRGVRGARGDQSSEVLGIKRTVQDRAVLFITNRSLYFCKSKVLRRGLIQEVSLHNATHVTISDGRLHKGLSVAFNSPESVDEKPKTSETESKFTTFRFRGGSRTRNRALAILRNVISCNQFITGHIDPIVESIPGLAMERRTELNEKLRQQVFRLLQADTLTLRALWKFSKGCSETPLFVESVTKQMRLGMASDSFRWMPCLFHNLELSASQTQSPRLRRAASAAFSMIGLNCSQRAGVAREALAQSDLAPLAPELHCWNSPTLPFPKTLGIPTVQTRNEIKLSTMEELLLQPEESVERVCVEVALFDQYYLATAELRRGDIAETLSQLNSLGELVDVLKQILVPGLEALKCSKLYIQRIQSWENTGESFLVAVTSLSLIWFSAGLSASNIAVFLIMGFVATGYEWKLRRTHGTLSKLYVPVPRPKSNVLDLYKKYKEEYRRVKVYLRQLSFVMLKLRGLLTWEDPELAKELYGFMFLIGVLLWLIPSFVWQLIVWLAFFTKKLRSGYWGKRVKGALNERWNRVSLSPLHPPSVTKLKNQ